MSKPIFRIATELEGKRAVALARCSLPPASMTKRFARDLKYQIECDFKITDKQSAFLAVCCYRCRRQLPDDLVPETPPEGYMTPNQRKAEAALEHAMRETR
jgi:hypothetical protein